MAITESDIIRDEQERSNLLRAIADVETAIAVSTPGTRRVLENTLDNAKKRVGVLDKKIEDAKVEHAAEVQAQVAAATLLAAKETKLNADEQRTYGNFLKEDFFTKNDFGKLAQFYAHTWDRLSQSGKDEMSHRIWEGVRHHEFRFSDLPDPVKEREEKQAYRRLHDPNIGEVGADDISAKDRADFLRAYETGKHKEATKVLDRESFQHDMFLGVNSREIRNMSVTASKTSDAQAVASNMSGGVNSAKPSDHAIPADSLNSLDMGSIDLTGMRSAEHPLEGAIANLARSRTGNVRES